VSAPEPVSALASSLLAHADGAPEVMLADRQAGLALIAARRGQDAHVDAALRQHLAVGLPTPGRALVTGDVAARCTAPGTVWIEGSARHLAALAGAMVRDVAAIVDQSGGFAILRLSGPKSPVVLAKGCRLDLHPDVFGPGHCARTLIAQVPAILHQTDAQPTYDLLVPRTLARSFAEFLVRAAQASGIRLSASMKPEESRKPQ
jgi:heterotetrameric sarcosine oxidase gamma subunit